ncbi:prepilin peptidase [Roseateles toxinivorans]|uniref:Prepilin leader peptidase/N-methyltransferase n=1 Tax=Roseateles toxinivorans TaxID=270368 RepID=A0A4R6QJX3_9BURK|nr:A24 family peptidase [Roseateles toxinivorans]TDP62799.1 type 4 prepilin peptidase 1 [Roseateles toxinivorans]
MDAELIHFLLSPWALGILGLCVGSFLNVVVHRVPLMMEHQWLGDAAAHLGDKPTLQKLAGLSAAEADKVASAAALVSAKVEALPALTIAKPRSRCPSCGHQLAWHENMPLIGWLRLRGRCSACKTPISPRYPVVEALTGLLFAAIGWRFGAQELTLLWCAFAAALVALAAIDWDTTLLPDSINQPLLWAGLVVAAAGWTLPLQQALIGACAGYLSLWSVYWLFKLTTGKEGMGYGDFKLLAALGAWLGWQMILPIVLGASVIGAVVGIAMKMSSSLREGRYVPFGPFLVGGGLVALLAGPQRVLGWMGWA